jgi:aminomethyltransferase
MAPFAGWEMPLLYSSAKDEHMAVRSAAGIFDVSHMGQLELTGDGAHAYLQERLSNDLDRLDVGQGQYTLLLTDDAGVIDDLIAYRLADRYFLVVNASNTDACRDALGDGLPTGVELVDRSREWGMLALQGPGWAEALSGVADAQSAIDTPYFSVIPSEVAGEPCLLARTGYTGEPGVEILCPWDGTVSVWDALQDSAGAPSPAGLVSRDTLRIEVGYPLHGNELSLARTPIEAALRFACDLEHGGFVGADVVLRQAREGTAERLAAFELTEPGIPRAGQAVVAGGEPVGTVTSGTLSPVLGHGIGMAYVPAELAAPGTDVEIDIRGKRKAARTARRPLVDTSPTKKG